MSDTDPSSAGEGAGSSEALFFVGRGSLVETVVGAFALSVAVPLPFLRETQVPRLFRTR